MRITRLPARVPLALPALLVLLTLGLVPCASVTWADPPAANFRSVSGAVTVERAGSSTAPAPGDPLLVGDILRTGPDGKAGVSFQDGTRIAVGPGSELTVQSYRFVPLEKDYDFDVYMQRGEAAYSSGRLAKLAPEAVRFRTPQAAVGVRGTRFLIRAE
ncbi:FecR domain-containing protein [Nitratidesulfovibrio sp.]|uniref:FecR family protein n=1 Tax=Nitratidesulfovibrio sp. TaxID=2802297 RepID=UPI00333F4FEB